MLFLITHSVKMKTLEGSFGVWVPMHTPILLSLTVICILAHLHLKHNYIQSKTTGHGLVPYLPPSPRKVISSHSESRFKSPATSAPLCQVSFDLIVTLQGLGVLAA